MAKAVAVCVRFLFLDRSDLGAIRRHAERHLAYYQAQLERWGTHRDTTATQTHDRIIDRLADSPPEEHRFVTTMKWFAFDGLVRRARMEIGWAEDILKWLDATRSKTDAAPLPETTRIPTTAPKRRTQAG